MRTTRPAAFRVRPTLKNRSLQAEVEFTGMTFALALTPRELVAAIGKKLVAVDWRTCGQRSPLYDQHDTPSGPLIREANLERVACLPLHEEDRSAEVKGEP